MQSNAIRIMLLIFILTAFIRCNQNPPVITDVEKYKADIEQWQQDRLERMKGKNGWLNLAGLYWLEEGINTFGSDSTNDIVFPSKAPAFCGTLTRHGDTVQLEVKKGVEIIYRGQAVSEADLTTDKSDNPEYLVQGDLAWYIMNRHIWMGVRLRDYKNPRIDKLDHIPSYPIDPDYVVEARLVPFDESRIITVNTPIEGYTQDYESPGELQFKLKGRKLSLLPFKSENGYFLIIEDETSGIETYGAGRFMYTRPDSSGRIILDFNKAYNPPCAFTPFATCPMPPRDNYLPVKIEAGEKMVHIE